MPTSFTSPTNGQVTDVSHVTQFIAPINNLESGAALYAESAGSSTAYTATLTPVPALVSGLTIRLKIDETNSGAATLNVNGLGAVDIRYDNGSAYNTALPASLLKAGGVYQFTYQGTYWLVTGGAAAAPDPLSADGIAQLLGFADAAAMVEAIGQYCVAGGTVDAITLTVPDWSEVDGAKLSFRASGGNSGAVTIAVNGGTARDLRKSSQAIGIGVLNGGELLGLHTVQWDSANSIFRLLNYRTTKEDIPSTLNATTFAGDVQSSGNYGLYKSANTGYLPLAGGNGYAQSQGAYDILFGNSHSTNPGDAHRYCGSASGAAHSFFDKNGAGRQIIQEDGVSCISPVVSVGTSFTTLRAVAGNQALMIATVTGIGSILLEWDGSTLTKLAGVSTLVVAGSAGAGETAFRVSGGNLQAIVDTGTRNVSSGFSVRH